MQLEQTLHSKLMRIVVITLLFVSGSTFAVVTTLNYISAMQNTGRLERQIREGIREKGRLLCEGSAMALQSMVEENAISSVKDLVDRSVRGDPDVVYGMYKPVDEEPWAFSGPTQDAEDAWRSLQFQPPPPQGRDDPVSIRQITTFGQEVYEFAAPVIFDRAVVGFIVYGLSTQRMHELLEQARMQGWMAILWVLLSILVLVGANLWLGVKWTHRASERITRPLERLTAVANDMASGVVGTRAQIDSGDELEVLGRAYNEMAEAVERREAELRTALVAAQEAGRLKGEFLANMSHELRTPLNAIINIPSALLRDYKEFLLLVCSSCDAEYEAPEGAGADYVSDENCPSCNESLRVEPRAFFYGDATEHYKYQRQVHACARHLHKLVSDVLDFSKAEANRLELNLGEHAVGEVLAEVGETAQLLAKDKGLELTIDGMNITDTFICDRTKIAQVLMNLIGNAAKFTPKGGSITVRADISHTENVRFTVTDTGIGIPADQLETIFESFRQVDGSHTRAYGGTGLGLAISRQLATLHRGKLWCESELERGSTFILELPRAGVSPGENGIKRVARNEIRKILLIDDDPRFFEPIIAQLQPMGFNISQTHDASKAMEMIRTLRPDLVVLDVMMPSVDGLSILREVRADETFAEMCVVVSSGFPSNRELATELGAYWLRKPWTLEDFLTALTSLQGRSAAQAPASEELEEGQPA